MKVGKKSKFKIVILNLTSLGSSSLLIGIADEIGLLIASFLSILVTIVIFFTILVDVGYVSDWLDNRRAYKHIPYCHECPYEQKCKNHGE